MKQKTLVRALGLAHLFVYSRLTQRKPMSGDAEATFTAKHKASQRKT
jgi:hypothetical protein